MSITASSEAAPAARAFAAAKRGAWDEAAAIIRTLAEESFGLDIATATVSRDGYSLNSVNGFLTTTAGEELFFKFHHEEGEEHTLREFYQAELLGAAGYPVDMPLHASREVGRQLLLYRRRRSPRFADLCRRLDTTPEAEIVPALAAQADLDALTAAIYRRTLHATSAAEVAREPVHQLFHARLIDPDRPDRLGGRARRFFFDREFDLAGTALSADRLRAARWRINGVA